VAGTLCTHGLRRCFLFSPCSREPMGSALFALFPRVIGVPVMGRAYSGASTLSHADLYEVLRKLEGEGLKYLREGRIISLLNAE
jgi:hypothetical protein